MTKGGDLTDDEVNSPKSSVPAVVFLLPLLLVVAALEGEMGGRGGGKMGTMGDTGLQLCADELADDDGLGAGDLIAGTDTGLLDPIELLC